VERGGWNEDPGTARRQRNPVVFQLLGLQLSTDRPQGEPSPGSMVRGGSEVELSEHGAKLTWGRSV
jgi:hypothetical protein